MKVVAAPLPEGALLHAYAERGALVDCWAVELPQALDLTDYLLGFAHCWLFRLERRLLGWAGHPTTASDVQALAMGSAQGFAIWRVVVDGGWSQAALCGLLDEALGGKHQRD